jgi:signal transduction histidine kinase
MAGQVALVLAIPEARPPIPDRLQNLVLVAGIWLVGNAIRAMREGMDRAERERRLAAQVAAAEERALIARELHDVVAHGVSVMVVQAGAARQVMAKRPDRATEALRTVETTGREALSELRHLLGLLHDDGAEAALTPRAGLDQLDALVERTRAAGLPVRLSVEGKPRALPAGLDLTAYRIVQEALTNALKYSGMASTEVVVRYRDGELLLQVRDRGAESPGGKPGRGLIGMKERARLYGGDLEAGPGIDGGYLVSARLPTEPS